MPNWWEELSPEDLQALVDQVEPPRGTIDLPVTISRDEAPASSPTPVVSPVVSPSVPATFGKTAYSALDTARGLRPELLKQLGWTGGATFTPGHASGGESGDIVEDAINPEFEKFLADNNIKGSYDLNGENVTAYFTKGDQLLDKSQFTTGVDHGALWSLAPMLPLLMAAPALASSLGGGAMGAAGAGAITGGVNAGVQGGDVMRGALMGGALGYLGGSLATPDVADIATAPRTAVGNMDGLLEWATPLPELPTPPVTPEIMQAIDRVPAVSASVPDLADFTVAPRTSVGNMEGLLDGQTPAAPTVATPRVEDLLVEPRTAVGNSQGLPSGPSFDGFVKFLKDNPLLFAGAGALLSAAGSQTPTASGYRDSGYRPTITRGGWQASVTPPAGLLPASPSTAAPGLLTLPQTGQANDGAWRYLLGR